MRNIPRYALPALILFMLFACLIEPVEGQQLKLAGKVVETATRHGIAALSVRLTASREMGQPQRITATNIDGEFKFTDLVRGRYMLEVSQGNMLLHREFLSVEADTERLITLRKKQ